VLNGVEIAYITGRRVGFGMAESRLCRQGKSPVRPLKGELIAEKTEAKNPYRETVHF
jgi:hypothetical protein